jgi:nucleoside 2-deoxyribosyltransferase
LGIKYHSDHSNKGRIDKLSSIIEKLGYSVTCIARDIERYGQVSLSPCVLMKKTFQIMDESDLAIIDMSEKGVGLGIEAGYAYSKGLPLITIAHCTEISTTILGISRNHFVYKNDDELELFLQSILGKHNKRLYSDAR